MNRRDFLKFLGKATVATGAAVTVGLPEALPEAEAIEDNFQSSFCGEAEYTYPKELARWNGITWTEVGNVSYTNDILYDDNGILYIGGEGCNSTKRMI